jgi:hypothetical protein
MDSIQAKKIIVDAINDSAKLMLDRVEQIPDSSIKSEWITRIENVRKENLRQFKDLTSL